MIDDLGSDRPAGCAHGRAGDATPPVRRGSTRTTRPRSLLTRRWSTFAGRGSRARLTRPSALLTTITASRTLDVAVGGQASRRREELLGTKHLECTGADRAAAGCLRATRGRLSGRGCRGGGSRGCSRRSRWCRGRSGGRRRRRSGSCCCRRGGGRCRRRGRLRTGGENGAGRAEAHHLEDVASRHPPIKNGVAGPRGLPLGRDGHGILALIHHGCHPPRTWESGRHKV